MYYYVMVNWETDEYPVNRRFTRKVTGRRDKETGQRDGYVAEVLYWVESHVCAVR